MVFDSTPGPQNPLKASPEVLVGIMHTGDEFTGNIVNTNTGLMFDAGSWGQFAVSLFRDFVRREECAECGTMVDFPPKMEEAMCECGNMVYLQNDRS